MSFTPRPYQTAAIDSIIDFFKSTSRHHGICILPTGSGKSVVIANAAMNMDGNTLILQPSKEILEQNFAKFRSYGYRASIYSASLNQKRIDKVTFATIGSIARKHHLFQDFKNIIIDECHLVNSKEGMYNDLIKAIAGAKVCGLTATPYRLTNSLEGAMLKFLTRTRPRIFSQVLYTVQNSVLFESGFLSPLKYYHQDIIDRSKLALNSTGTDFTEDSLKRYYSNINMPAQTVAFANRLLAKRKNLLVFCSLIEEAEKVVANVPGAVLITGKTEKKERERILDGFKSGKIKCLVNVGVLTTGFDYPALECILLARSTMSLSLYYQMVGRGMRTAPGKEDCWIVDLGGNIKLFGKVETITVETGPTGLYYISNNGKQLTNVPFTKAA